MYHSLGMLSMRESYEDHELAFAVRAVGGGGLSVWHNSWENHSHCPCIHTQTHPLQNLAIALVILVFNFSLDSYMLYLLKYEY